MAESAVLNFEYDVDSDVDGNNEGFFVQISEDNGANYTTVFTYENTSGSGFLNVETASIDLTNFMTFPNINDIRIRFITNNQPSNNESFWFDNIVLDVTEDYNYFY